MISAPDPNELQEAIDNFMGPYGQLVLEIIEAGLDLKGSTSNATLLQPLKSALDKNDVNELEVFFVRIGKDNVSKFNGYFAQLAQINARRKAKEEKPEST